MATADRCLGKLLAAAQAARPDRLVSAVTSDHGEGLGDHGEATHGLFVYESTLRVPMVISGSGVPSGKRSSSLARTADLAPTLLALLGASSLPDVDGRDLSAPGEAGEAYAETDYPRGFGWAALRSWRLGDLKFIDAPEAELYDLSHDSGEVRNLAMSQPKDVERLRGVLRAALVTETRRDERRLDALAEEGLRSLGYVGSAPKARPGEGAGMDPKLALPLLRDFELAMAAEARGALSASAGILTGLTSKDPTNLTFQRSLASALRRSSRLDESVRVLKAAERLAPKDATVAHDLALILAQGGDSIRAMEFEERAVALDPQFVDALAHLSTLAANLGDIAKARHAADRAIAIDGNDARLWSNLGNIARARSQPDEAERSFRRALELAPDLVDAINGLGVVAVERGRLDEAALRFARALELAPGLDEARLNLAVVEAQRGNPQKAFDLASEVEKTARDPALRARAADFATGLKGATR